MSLQWVVNFWLRVHFSRLVYLHIRCRSNVIGLVFHVCVDICLLSLSGSIVIWKHAYTWLVGHVHKDISPCHYFGYGDLKFSACSSGTLTWLVSC